MKRVIPLLLTLVLLLACVPTPEEEAIVPPSGYEAAILNPKTPSAQADAVPLPEHWSDRIELKYWDIEIEADISPNAVGATPVYESRYVHLDEIETSADRVKRGLLKDAASYSDATLTKADWYRQIQLYADTPVWDGELQAYTRYRTDEEVKSYTESLASFIDEAPIELEYHPFSPQTDAFPELANYVLSDGSLAWMHADHSSISVRYGADIFIDAEEQAESWVMGGDALPGEPKGTRIEGVTIEEQTAREQATALMEMLGLFGFKIANAEKARFVRDDTQEIITVGYRIMFCRAEADYEAAYGTVSQSMLGANSVSGQLAYRPGWFQEQIDLFVDDTGVRSFFWTSPTAKPVTVNENVEILSFEKVRDIIVNHLKNCVSVEEDEEVFKEWYAGRAKYLVAHVGLYMGIIPKKNDTEAFYYGPVWVVTVLGYPADADTEALPYTMTTQYLHVNAIDGSLIAY